MAKSVDVDTAVDVILIGTLAAVWLTAGLLVDTLPAAGTARRMGRRAGLLSFLAAAGAAMFVAVPAIAAALPGGSAAPTAALLPALPALVALSATVRRLGQIRRGAGAFATAPQAPVPPALRAAAAHPLVAVPLQVTGLAAVIGLPLAGGLVELPAQGLPEFTGIAATAVAIGVAAIGIRAALRHSRLVPLVLAPLGRVRRPVQPD